MKTIFSTLFLLFISASTFSQVTTQRNTIYLSLGTNHIERTASVDAGSVNVQVEYVRTLSHGFDVDTTLSFSGDRIVNTSNGRTVSNITFLEYYPAVKSKRILPFVGAGLTVSQFSSRSTGSLVSVNPTFEAGIDVNIRKLQVEPFVQAAIPDLNQSARTYYVGGGVNAFYNMTNHLGFRITGFAAENRWHGGNGISTNLVGGVFFSF